MAASTHDALPSALDCRKQSALMEAEKAAAESKIRALLISQCQPKESTTDCDKQKCSQDTAPEKQIYAFEPSRRSCHVNCRLTVTCWGASQH